MFRALIVFISMLLAPSLSFANEAAESWVIGSYVNVRSQPSSNAEVVGHLVANTPVKLLSQQEEFCEITWGNNQQGFVACKLLGDKALRIEDIGKKPKYNYNEKPNPQYSPQRAFWIEPTVERLFDAGEHFRNVMLSAEQLRAENCFLEGCFDDGTESSAIRETENAHRGSYVFKRFSIPEFDAMKKLMADGFIAPRSQYASPTAWNKIQPIIKLPKTKPSFFKSMEEIGRPSANAEQLSAQYQIPHRVVVLNKPVWGGDNNSYPILMGAWDIGRVESRLTRPVYEVAIGIDGEVSIGETEATTTSLRGEDRCDGLFELGTSKKLLPGYEQIQQPWIIFRLATIPALTKAKVSGKKIKNDIDPEDNTSFVRPTTGVDIDNDGVLDLFVWDDGTAGYDHTWPGNRDRTRLIFANVGGQWYLLDTDGEHACGC